MRNNTINGLLKDAETAIHIGRHALAHRLLSAASRIAAADRTYPAAKAGAIVAARLAVAALLP